MSWEDVGGGKMKRGHSKETKIKKKSEILQIVSLKSLFLYFVAKHKVFLVFCSHSVCWCYCVIAWMMLCFFAMVSSWQARRKKLQEADLSKAAKRFYFIYLLYSFFFFCCCLCFNEMGFYSGACSKVEQKSLVVVVPCIVQWGMEHHDVSQAMIIEGTKKIEN